MRMVYEKVVADDQGSFRCLEWKEKDFDCPHHFHPEIEITQIVASRGERLVGDCFDTFAPGDLAMFGSGLPHFYKNWKSGNAHSRCLQFLPDAFGDKFFDLPEFAAVRSLIQDASRGVRFSPPIRKEGCRLITRLFKMPTSARRLGALMELLDVLSSDNKRQQIASLDFRVPEDNQQSRQLEQILNYIDANWQQKIETADVAAVAGLHPQSLSRYFRRNLGMTYQQYLIELRLSRSARELLETKRLVSDIAFSCGFNNLANFNRLFLARYETSPSSYRSK